MAQSVVQPGRPLVVMYHYVHPELPAEPAGVRPLLAREFEAQLDALATRYEILPPAEFLTAIAHPNSARPPCLLTFDDGTADHATVVTPILARRKLSGVFFVLSGPATEGLMPLTHAVHWALSLGDDRVWAALSREASAAGTPIGDEIQARRMYHYEPPLRAQIKFAANVALPPDVTARALDHLAVELGTPRAFLARRWFVSESQITAMHRAGMTIGLHGHTHRSLQQMGPGVAGEMRTCADMVRRCTGENPTWWACPFGGTGASPELHHAMQAAMQDLGIVAAVSTESRSVAASHDALRLPRIDCIRLPPRAPW